ncbi:hypothetical protein CAI21_13345 [Alkalilimnicola ehrlichii]|uniref:Gamma-glutamylcyclotransferase family protein n=1 Tax=Alkalilimnicola ehrlichii TaxID=351052 RepID=A0A3E0WSD1_9GAMM|nr:gamma-glutamylcyclotransferase family protein [Alkalilimnicola ehrlichii]RFA28294.1 hypothetical protein CAI21_13345 [Alkalilimnicola ehrlichii]RFA34895.1 hypothetical protein CAL65_14480 [Alkalilimnicola ehrlichii]
MAGLDLVFVYGTLRRGGTNHHWLDGAEWLGYHRTEPKFQMLDLGPYPGVVRPGTDAIVGELYRINALMLKRLDRLEDYPVLYTRTRIPTDHGHAWLYLYRCRDGSRYPRIRQGDWLACQHNQVS